MKGNFKKTLLWASAASAIVTAFSWLVLGINSPANHGAPPDVHHNPIIILLVVPNLPAGIVCVNLFGKHGPEWTYFLCVFIQWFLLVALAARLWVWMRKLD